MLTSVKRISLLVTMVKTTFRSRSWKETAIKAAMKSPESVEDIIEQTFTESWYSYEDIKKMLQDIYDDCCPGFTAKATDLRKYLECREKKETIDGRRVNGYRIKRENNNKL